MAWVVLVLSGCMEAVWALSLSASKGFTKLLPSILFFVGMALSMAGLSWALRTIPVGAGYAVWTGIGAVVTLVASIALGYEQGSILKYLCAAMIIGGVIGMKLVTH